MYKAAYIKTHTHTHTHRENRNERENLLFAAVFSPKTTPNVLKNRTKPAFHPWVFPKRSLDSPKATSNQKKNPEKKREFSKQVRTL